MDEGRPLAGDSLQSAHHQVALGEQGGDLGHIGERRVRLVQVPAELLERRPQNFRSTTTAARHAGR